eukprot:gene8024-biopygen10605
MATQAASPQPTVGRNGSGRGPDADRTRAARSNSKKRTRTGRGQCRSSLWIFGAWVAAPGIPAPPPCRVREAGGGPEPFPARGVFHCIPRHMQRPGRDIGPKRNLSVPRFPA